MYHALQQCMKDTGFLNAVQETFFIIYWHKNINYFTNLGIGNGSCYG